jgi:transposase-like protein
MATSIFDQPRFKDPEAARTYLEELRWPKGAFCPHCGGADRQAKIAANPKKSVRPGLYECGHCGKQYTVTVGTVFERSKIALHKWLMAATLLAASKKGMSSHQLHRLLGVTYKTAWFMSHRLREAMKSDGGLLGGGGSIVEADETYWGNARPIKTRGPKNAHGGWGHKNKVVALVERTGKTRAFHVADVTGETLKPILQGNIKADSHLMTDSASYYRNMERGHFLSHEMVNHSQDEYARPSEAIPGKVAHTNTVESFFGLFKRGLVGTYHHVSVAHLQRYCEEFSFRHSHRTSLGYTDEQRADAALKQIAGKRLTYRRINAASKTVS